MHHWTLQYSCSCVGGNLDTVDLPFCSLVLTHVREALKVRAFSATSATEMWMAQ